MAETFIIYKKKEAKKSMIDLNKIYLNRMTHIDNIPHILQYGITHVTSANFNVNYRPIGDGDLISARNSHVLNNGRTLGEYIPFYFAVRTPMLYVIQKGYNMVSSTPRENIVYCVVPVQKIIDLGLDFAFTDGHAVNGLTTQYSKGHISNLNTLVDWNAVKAKYWKDDNDLDLKRRKEAEFLVLGDIATDAIRCFLVFNEEAKNLVVNFGANPINVLVKSECYF
jgi:hypothetical protein